MDKELKELVDDYIRAYKAYNKKENPDSYDYTCMQSPAIRIITILKKDFHMTFEDIYNMCVDLKKGKTTETKAEVEENLVMDNKENQLNEKLDEKIEEKVLKLDDNLSFNLFDNV